VKPRRHRKAVLSAMRKENRAKEHGLVFIEASATTAQNIEEVIFVEYYMFTNIPDLNHSFVLSGCLLGKVESCLHPHGLLSSQY
jgi:hypothetical protein